MTSSDRDATAPPEPQGAGAPPPESGEPGAPKRAGTPIAVPLFKEPPVVLTDPPAIFGGASHTW
ncbi:MAG TPA: hypothetical protein VMT77_10120 [Gemmatimonadales bacterium]|nr:hypothetical protein [Gemmatimonadales bacterium]